MTRVATPVEVISQGPEETREIGARLGRMLRSGDVVLLHGDLGSGKTTLTQGIARGLGVQDYVQSPTFTLVAEHEGRDASDGPVRLYHLDLYRLSDETELESFGFDQYLAPVDGVAVVEWPERAGEWLPDRYLLVRLVEVGADARRLTVSDAPAGAFAAVVARM
ncbi:MAG: tRNA (adenosine(37)-N6)-threonylcarbamoyltransferase complex ATPase subunit type 1 TsaE [Thermomicrobiales bacterium]